MQIYAASILCVECYSVKITNTYQLKFAHLICEETIGAEIVEHRHWDVSCILVCHQGAAIFFLIKVHLKLPPDKRVKA